MVYQAFISDDCEQHFKVISATVILSRVMGYFITCESSIPKTMAYLLKRIENHMLSVVLTAITYLKDRQLLLLMLNKLDKDVITAYL